jgi:NTE family protein
MSGPRAAYRLRHNNQLDARHAKDPKVRNPLFADRIPDVYCLHDCRRKGRSVTVPPVGLALSGGGFRAVQFHLGALTQLNEFGLLQSLTRISGVSGGSFVAAMMGLKWHQLRFTETGHAENLAQEIVAPLLALTRTNIDIRATGRLGAGRANRYIAHRLDNLLYNGATLQDLPDDSSGPRVIVCATDAQTGQLFRMSRPYAREWHDPDPWINPTIPISAAVAASAAFPPFLAPARMPTPEGTRDLIDGGVYDNYGLEVHLKKDYHLLISDGGQIFAAKRYPRNRLLASRRVLSLIEEQARRLRRRQLTARVQGSFTFWSLSTPEGAYRTNPEVPRNPGPEYGTWRVGTRLAALQSRTSDRLMAIGKSRCKAALTEYPVSSGC